MRTDVGQDGFYVPAIRGADARISHLRLASPAELVGRPPDWASSPSRWNAPSWFDTAMYRLPTVAYVGAPPREYADSRWASPPAELQRSDAARAAVAGRGGGCLPAY